MPNSRLNSTDEIGETPGVVIEDGDVAAGHVGDVDVVPLLDQPDQRAAHADDVVVGMRAEDQAPSCGVGAGRAGVQMVRHHLVEDAPAQHAGRAVLAQQFVKLVLAEIVVGELRAGALLDLQAQPDDRLADQRRRPVDRADASTAGERPSGRRRPPGRAGTWRRDAAAGSWPSRRR